MTAAPTGLAQALADRYRIERELGAGGMATVYLAHDIRHDRQVAVKVIRPELMAVLGTERFLAEIRTTAHLQHPHILGLIDSGEVNGTAFYVMPFVQGESLRDRLRRQKQLNVDDAVRIARDVAMALDFAHRQGVIHRDIKPENILLQDGQAMVADFGIALAATTSSSGRLTETGMSLGTPQYMSPEQAMGEREITAASDVYSLGCVLYEALAGEPPFSGPTAQAIVAKVMSSAPVPIVSLRRTVPEHVAAAVEMALEKVPADRFRTAAEFAEALADAGRGTVTRVVPQARRLRAFIAGGLPVALGAGIVIGILVSRPAIPPSPPRPVEFTVEPAAGTAMAGTREYAVSPDGTRLVFATTGPGASSRLVVRDFASAQQRAIPGSDDGVAPFFSPDGEWVVFRAGNRLKKAPLDGGPVIDIATLDGSLWEGSWGLDDTLVVAVGGTHPGLFKVPAGGGALAPLVPGDTAGYVTARHTPAGSVIAVSRIAGLDSLSIELLAKDGGGVALGLSGYLLAILTNGDLVFGSPNGQVVSQPMDWANRRTRGTAQVVLTGVRVSRDLFNLTLASAGANGSLAFESEGGATGLFEVQASGLERLVLRGEYIAHPRYSPDGRRVAFRSAGSDGVSVWVVSLADSSRQLLIRERGTITGPTWMPGGRQLLLSLIRNGQDDLYLLGADGQDSLRPLLSRPGLQRFAEPTPDHAVVLTSDRDIGRWRVGQDSIEPIVSTAANEMRPAVSPDGRWVAYSSSVTGQFEVYLTSLVAPGPRDPISTGGGDEAAWSPDGRTLYYRAGGAIFGASLDLTGGVRILGRTRLGFEGFNTEEWGRNYDIHPDGKRFLFVRSDSKGRLVVRLNAVAPNRH